MSPRSFARSFVEEAGITPHDFIERARIDVARNLLEGSDLALKGVAFECGFGNADRLRIVITSTSASRPRSTARASSASLYLTSRLIPPRERKPPAHVDGLNARLWAASRGR